MSRKEQRDQKKVNEMTKQIDLNCDLGESFGAYKIGYDEDILDIVTSANIACGFHAGDYNIMAKTVKMAQEKNVAVGAHPGFPDLIGFGRRPMQIDPEEVYHFVVYQIGALQAFCNIHDANMQHVKPHGALYNMAARDPKLADAVARAVRDVNAELVLFGLAGSELLRAGEESGLRTASEVFADRTYQADGSLTPRTEGDALITDPAVAEDQVIRMVTEGKVTALDGTSIHIEADTICVHGDGVEALEFARRIRKRLENEGINVQSAGE